MKVVEDSLVVAAIFGVRFALVEHVHVVLADGDLTLVLLEASQQALVERHAWVLILLLLSSCLALRVVHLLLLMLLLSGLRVAARAAAHHGADSLVTDLRTGTESGTLHHR